MEQGNWIKEMFDAVDNRDAEGFVSYFAEDGLFKFGNADPVEGKGAILEAIKAFFGGINAIEHQILDRWTLPDAAVCRGIVTYTRLDSSVLSVPFATIMKLAGEKIREYLIYADISQLFVSG